MKILINSLIILLITSCSSICKLEKEKFSSHSCPKPGHGPCFLCDDKDYSKPIYLGKDPSAIRRFDYRQDYNQNW